MRQKSFNNRAVSALLAFFIFVPSLSFAQPDTETAFTLTSSAFENNAQIPKEFTCKGQEKSPPLAWTGAPKATQSFALIVLDPDAPDPKAPTKTIIHWLAYGIPSSFSSLSADLRFPTASFHSGKNTEGKSAYMGPCPPVGQHRYMFHFYALNSLPSLPEGATLAQVEQAIKFHVIKETMLIGTFAADSK